MIYITNIKTPNLNADDMNHIIILIIISMIANDIINRIMNMHAIVTAIIYLF